MLQLEMLVGIKGQQQGVKSAWNFAPRAEIFLSSLLAGKSRASRGHRKIPGKGESFLAEGPADSVTLLGNKHSSVSWFFLLHPFIVFTMMAAEKNCN